MRTDKIALIMCLKKLNASGARLVHLTCFDSFPRTFVGDRFGESGLWTRWPATEQNRKTPNCRNRRKNWKQIGFPLFFQFCSYFAYFVPICLPILWIWGFFYSVAGRRNRKVRLPRASGKSPDFPESSQDVPGSSPRDLPGKFSHCGT